MLSEIVELKFEVFGWLLGSAGVALVGEVVPVSVAPWWADWALSMTLAIVPVVVVLIKRRKKKKDEEA